VRDAGVRPVKALGQHFLSDHSVVNRIVAAAELSPDDAVIEVGPGLGVLTEKLAEVAGRIIAVEVDAGLAAKLREKLAEAPNVVIVERDVLELTPRELLEAGGVAADAAYVVVANLPYNIGAAVVRRFLESERQPRRMVVMLQREVAESMTALPGDMSLLSVATQVYADARRLFNVPPRAFYPPPKVTSSVMRLDLRQEPLVPAGDQARFFRIVRAGFSAPRKQLRNSLAQGLRAPPSEVGERIESADLDPSLRPEQLSVFDWLALSRLFPRLAGEEA
jgi:16S rRNA (adenine1518-N6/adenine1519-N6)-dimethyltransferase